MFASLASDIVLLLPKIAGVLPKIITSKHAPRVNESVHVGNDGDDPVDFLAVDVKPVDLYVVLVASTLDDDRSK